MTDFTFETCDHFKINLEKGVKGTERDRDGQKSVKKKEIII